MIPTQYTGSQQRSMEIVSRIQRHLLSRQLSQSLLSRTESQRTGIDKMHSCLSLLKKNSDIFFKRSLMSRSVRLSRAHTTYDRSPPDATSKSHLDQTTI